jgi:hypothetical protein
MKLPQFVIIALLVLNISCGIQKNQNPEFEKIANNYIENILRLNPGWATNLGDHRYDHLMDDYSIEGGQGVLPYTEIIWTP